MKKIDSRKGDRHYRKPYDETPTHTGGLSKEAKERLDYHARKERDRGVYASTKVKQPREESERSRKERRGDSRDRRYDHRDRRDDRNHSKSKFRMLLKAQDFHGE